jgi:hypothetical protein
MASASVPALLDMMPSCLPISAAAAAVSQPSAEAKKFRTDYPVAGFRQYEPSEETPEAWSLARKAAAEMGPNVIIRDSKSLTNACRSLPTFPYSGSGNQQPTYKMSSLSADVAAKYFFVDNGVPFLTLKETEMLFALKDAEILSQLQWHGKSRWVRKISEFVGNFRCLPAAALILDWFRRGHDPEYWVFQDAIRGLYR